MLKSNTEEGEWLVFNRTFEFVVIPMIAFIEGGMELPMGRVTWEPQPNVHPTSLGSLSA